MNLQDSKLGKELPKEAQNNMDSLVFRLEVLSVLLEVGIPLEALKNRKFRDLLEKSGYFLPTDLSRFIPTLRDLEIDRLRRELDSKDVLFMFDCASLATETLLVVARFWSPIDLVPTQRIVACRFLEKSPDAKTLAGELVDLYSRR